MSEPAEKRLYIDGRQVGQVPAYIYDFALQELRGGTRGVDIVRALKSGECPAHMAALVVVNARAEARHTAKESPDAE